MLTLIKGAFWRVRESGSLRCVGNSVCVRPLACGAWTVGITEVGKGKGLQEIG